MVDNMKSVHGSDAKRVFADRHVGRPANDHGDDGAYPDGFAAARSKTSSGPYAVRDQPPATNTVCGGSVNNTPAQWGALVRHAFTSYAGAVTRRLRSRFQGSSDSRCRRTNLQWKVDQWSNLLGNRRDDGGQRDVPDLGPPRYTGRERALDDRD